MLARTFSACENQHIIGTSALIFIFMLLGAQVFAGAWFMEKKITPSDGTSDDYFGSSVIVSGDTVIVGANGSGLSAWTGSAYIFERDDNGDWIEDGTNGFFFEGGNHEMLADRIIRLLENPTLAAKIGKEGRKVIVERLNYQSELERVESLYAELASRGRQ